VRRRSSSWRRGIARHAFKLSAPNLAHFLMLRRRDLRDLQDQLTLRGLSSLGRARGPCTGNLDAVIAALGPHVGEPTRLPSARTFYRGERLLARNSIELFGRHESRRRAIMVTLGTDAAEEPDLVLASSAVAWTSPESNGAHDATGRLGPHGRETAPRGPGLSARSAHPVRSRRPILPHG
jgi:pyruvate kinase